VTAAVPDSIRHDLVYRDKKEIKPLGRQTAAPSHLPHLAACRRYPTRVNINGQRSV
jgi:hypothetical protein